MANIVALDFESTGLLKADTDDPTQQPGIVEIGVVKRISNTSNIEWFNFQKLIDPETHFEDEAQKISGITAAETYGKPNFREVFMDFAQFVLGADYLFTFNGSGFDIPLLQFNLRRYGLETRFPWPPIQYDIMKCAFNVTNMQGKTGNKYPKLIELYTSFFGEEFTNQHRALEDAQATMKCGLHMIEKGYIQI